MNYYLLFNFNPFENIPYSDDEKNVSAIKARLMRKSGKFSVIVFDMLVCINSDISPSLHSRRYQCCPSISRAPSKNKRNKCNTTYHVSSS